MPIHYAAENNSKEMLELLLSKGVDINKKGIDSRNLKVFFLINGIYTK